jgi:hypothetical protein
VWQHVVREMSIAGHLAVIAADADVRFVDAQRTRLWQRTCVFKLVRRWRVVENL